MAKVTVVTVGSYGSRLIVPANKVGAMMEILSQCQFVSTEWLDSSGKEVLVMGKTEFKVSSEDGNSVLTQEELEATRTAAAAAAEEE